MTVTHAIEPPRGIRLFIFTFRQRVLFKMTENVSFTELTGVREHGKDNWTDFFRLFFVLLKLVTVK